MYNDLWSNGILPMRLCKKRISTERIFSARLLAAFAMQFSPISSNNPWLVQSLWIPSYLSAIL